MPEVEHRLCRFSPFSLLLVFLLSSAIHGSLALRCASRIFLNGVKKRQTFLLF